MTTLHIVSSPARAASLAPDALVIAASIPAAMCLRERGLRGLRLSDLAAPSDFHEIWETVFGAVWRAIESNAEPASDQPRVWPIFGYHFALAMTQVLVLGRCFDRVLERHAISRIEADHVADHGGTDALYALGVSNTLYAEAAQVWAAARGIDYQRRDPLDCAAPADPVVRRGVLATIRAVAKALLYSVPIEYGRVLWALFGGARTVILTHGSGALPSADTQPRHVATIPLNWYARVTGARGDDPAFVEFLRSARAPELLSSTLGS